MTTDRMEMAYHRASEAFWQQKRVGGSLSATKHCIRAAINAAAAALSDVPLDSDEPVAYKWMNAAGQLVFTTWKPTKDEALNRSVTPLYARPSKSYEDGVRDVLVAVKAIRADDGVIYSGPVGGRAAALNSVEEAILALLPSTGAGET